MKGYWKATDRRKWDSPSIRFFTTIRHGAITTCLGCPLLKGISVRCVDIVIIVSIVIIGDFLYMSGANKVEKKELSSVSLLYGINTDKLKKKSSVTITK